MSKLENVIGFAMSQFEVFKDSESVSMEAEMLLAVIRGKSLMRGGVMPTGVLTNEFNMNREASERWKTIQVGRVMSRLGFRPKRSNDGRAGWAIDKTLLSKLCKRYTVSESGTSQGKMI
jgi:hypothetical protein